MATLNLGKLKFNWRGNFALTTAYAIDDVVFDNGQAWIFRQAVDDTNNTRPQSLPAATVELMATGFNFRGDFDDTNEYFVGDVVTHDSSVFYCTTNNDPADDQEPNLAPLNTNWDEILPAPADNVLTTIGDLVVRDNTNANNRLGIGAAGQMLTVVEDPRESIPSRAITYDEPNENIGRARDTNDLNDATTTFGDGETDGVIFCTRGLVYTITVNVANSTRNFNLHTNNSGENANLLGTNHDAAANANVTNGQGTLTFAPDATTPNTVFIRDQNNSGRFVQINVVDMALTPGWGGAQDNVVIETPNGQNSVTLNTANMAANTTFTFPTTAPPFNGATLDATTAGVTQWGNCEAYVLIQERRASQNIATVANSWTQRQFTDIQHDPTNMASITNNTDINLPAGTYWIRIRTRVHDPGYCAIRLDNAEATNAGTLDRSTIGYAHPSYPADVMLWIENVFTFTEDPILELYHIVNVASPQGYTKVGTTNIDHDDQLITTFEAIRIA